LIGDTNPLPIPMPQPSLGPWSPNSMDTDTKGCGAGVVTMTMDTVLQRRAKQREDGGSGAVQRGGHALLERLGVLRARGVVRVFWLCG
jgi:hypothetical protein